MVILISSVILAVFISAFCSLTEAVFYSVPWSHIERLRKDKKKSGTLLYRLRLKVDEPITAILTLNTIANTLGATVAGAAAQEVFGADFLIYFSIGFTFLILVFSEIIPKTVGVVYNKTLSQILVLPLTWMVLFFRPAIRIMGKVAKLIKGKKTGPDTTEEDILALVSLTRKKGILKKFEEESISNILLMDTKTVKEIMTPRVVVFSLSEETKVEEAIDSNSIWTYSRIPVHSQKDPEDITGVVYTKNILEAWIKGKKSFPIKKLKKPVHYILESLTLDKVLLKFLESRIHLAVVIDEYGGFEGIVTLEDVLEEILGEEIVDETDMIADMRKLAMERKNKKQPHMDS